MALGALPWKDILKGATLAVSLARDLKKQQASQPKAVPPADADAASRLESLAQRVEALERSAQEQAKVTKMLAEEMQSLARRAMVGYWVGIAGLVIAVASLAAWLLR